MVYGYPRIGAVCPLLQTMEIAESRYRTYGGFSFCSSCGACKQLSAKVERLLVRLGPSRSQG